MLAVIRVEATDMVIGDVRRRLFRDGTHAVNGWVRDFTAKLEMAGRLRSTESRWWLMRKLENAKIWIAWHLPKSIAYWAFIRMAAKTNGNPGERTCGDVLDQHKDWA